MTISFGGESKWCGDCCYYNFVVCNELGVCVKIESEHNRHVLDASHPGCAFWKRRK